MNAFGHFLSIIDALDWYFYKFKVLSKVNIYFPYSFSRWVLSLLRSIVFLYDSLFFLRIGSIHKAWRPIKIIPKIIKSVFPGCIFYLNNSHKSKESNWNEKQCRNRKANKFTCSRVSWIISEMLCVVPLGPILRTVIRWCHF